MLHDDRPLLLLVKSQIICFFELILHVGQLVFQDILFLDARGKLLFGGSQPLLGSSELLLQRSPLLGLRGQPLFRLCCASLCCCIDLRSLGRLALLLFELTLELCTVLPLFLELQFERCSTLFERCSALPLFLKLPLKVGHRLTRMEP